MPGGKLKTIKRPKVYERLKYKYGKQRAAKIANTVPKSQSRRKGRMKRLGYF